MTTSYFPFRDDADRIESLAAKGRREHLFFGARGLGKTTVLEYLWRQLKETSKPPEPMFIEGRYAVRAIEQLGIAAASRPACVLIDDLDHFLGSPDNGDALEVFLRERGGLKDPERLAVIATSTLTLRELIDRAKRDSSSNFMMNSELIQLNAWPRDWEHQIDSAVKSISHQSALTHTWARAIAGVSGGHPTLVGGAIDEFTDLVSRRPHATAVEGSLLNEAVDDRSLQTFLRIRLASTSFARIARVIDQLPPDDRSILATAAVSDEGYLPELDPFRTARLLCSGLVREGLLKNRLRLRLVDGMISERLRVAPIVTKLELRHNPSESNPEDVGTLTAIVGEREIASVALTGSPWKVLAAIFENDGDIVPIKKLESRTQLHGTALNSALQRLRAALRAVGIERAIENVRNEGYRRADLPLYKQPRAQS